MARKVLVKSKEREAALLSAKARSTALADSQARFSAALVLRTELFGSCPSARELRAHARCRSCGVASFAGRLLRLARSAGPSLCRPQDMSMRQDLSGCARTSLASARLTGYHCRRASEAAPGRTSRSSSRRAQPTAASDGRARWGGSRVTVTWQHEQVQAGAEAGAGPKRGRSSAASEREDD